MILDLELVKVEERLAERGKQIRLSKGAREFLVGKGFDPDLGARPLRRAVERFVENPLAEDLLRGSFDKAKTISVGVSGDALSFKALAPRRKKIAQK